MNYPNSLRLLIESFKNLPGIGEKSAERLAFAVLEFDKEQIEMFSTSLKDVKRKLIKCKICHNISETETCEICQNKDRIQDIICVVDDPRNVILFERIGSYKGLYHVLSDLISPLDGINPEDINIETLINRVEEMKIKEVIIAVKPSIEGETTARYIRKILEGMNVIVTKIAHGIPMGADMQYIDPITLEMALEDRVKIE